MFPSPPFSIYIDRMDPDDKERLIELLDQEGIAWEHSGWFYRGIEIYGMPSNPEALEIISKYTSY